MDGLSVGVRDDTWIDIEESDAGIVGVKIEVGSGEDEEIGKEVGKWEYWLIKNYMTSNLDWLC